MIDFDNQKIIGCGKKTRERKSNAIMIPDAVMPVLRKLCLHYHESLIGMNRDAWYKEYHVMAGRIGIRDLPPYSCRHTTATVMDRMAEVAPMVITRAMRQTRAHTTERYKHASEQEILDALNQIDFQNTKKDAAPHAEESGL